MKGHWVDFEKKNFKRGVEACGRGNWSEIAKFVGTRTRIQVKNYSRDYRARLAAINDDKDSDDNTDDEVAANNADAECMQTIHNVVFPASANANGTVNAGAIADDKKINCCIEEIVAV
jgi:hypothetical protein